MPSSRKPRFTRRAIEQVAENRIREAMERGDFDELPGRGQPIADLDEPYDPDWWIKRWIRRERLRALPAELDAIRRGGASER